MDARRPNRAPRSPMVRQVGFVAPGSHSAFLARTQSVSPDATSSSSPPTDAVILPPRHRSNPVPVPMPVPLSPLHRDNLQIPIGSYNPMNDSSQLGTSPRLMSPLSNPRFDAGSSRWFRRCRERRARKAARSLPRSSGEMMALKDSGSASAEAAAPAEKSVLTTASVLKMVPGITDQSEAVV